MAKLTGTKPNQVPTNADLGTMAYQDADNYATMTIGTEFNPAASPAEIASNGLSDGWYWITGKDGNAFKTYVWASSEPATGVGYGWMLALKAVNSGDFLYSDSLWTSSTLYNTTDESLTGGSKSKFGAMTNYDCTRMMAIAGSNIGNPSSVTLLPPVTISSQTLINLFSGSTNSVTFSVAGSGYQDSGYTVEGGVSYFDSPNSGWWRYGRSNNQGSETYVTAYRINGEVTWTDGRFVVHIDDSGAAGDARDNNPEASSGSALGFGIYTNQSSTNQSFTFGVSEWDATKTDILPALLLCK